MNIDYGINLILSVMYMLYSVINIHDVSRMSGNLYYPIYKGPCNPNGFVVGDILTLVLTHHMTRFFY